MAVFKQRRGTAAALAAANETPAAGQIYFELDTNRIKIGDGTTPYNALPYLSSPIYAVSGLQAALDGKAAAVHTHTAAQIADFSSAAQAAVIDASLLTTGTLNPARLAASGVVAGTYTSVTVDQKGRVTAGSNIDPSALPAATASVVGGVKIGANVTVQPDGTISVSPPYSLPVATASSLGGVRQGDNVTIDGTGVISVAAPVTSLPYSAITGTPTLAAVATSGSYTDLTNVPAAYTLPVATSSVLGGVRQGANVTIDGTGVISVEAPVTTLPYSSITGTPALAKVATSGSYTDLTNAPAAYTLPAATNAVLGGVKIGSGVTVAGDGTISVTPGGTLPVASTTVLGGVKQGANVTIDGSGVLTANAPSFSSITAKPTTRAGYGITDASAPASVDVYTTSGTWTKPAGAKAVIVHAIGGGGGGGGGGNRAVGIVVGGGGGGGGGGRTIAWLDASLLPNSVPVTVGAGGLGGTGGTGAGNGTDGTDGGLSLFGATINAAWCFAHPGSKGGGGSGVGGGGGASGPGLFAGGPGNVGAAGTNSAPSTAAAMGGGGGGGGGQGLTAASVRTGGGSGAAVYGGYGFVVPSGNGGAGISVPANAPLAGTGANGGQSVANGAGGGGGAAGLYGGGGGGGGACTGTAFRAGAGGAGAQGIVVVMTFF